MTSPQQQDFPRRRAIALLTLLLVIGLALRLYDLGNLPNGLYPDEASNGYQAYSLWKTGAVEEGQRWPLMIPYLDGVVIEPLYVYALIPALALFDLSVFSIRLVAALAGGLTILGVYLVTRELFGRPTALVAAALAVASPWLLPWGRIAFGATLMPPLILLGLWSALVALRDERFLPAAALLIPLPLYTYAPAKAVVPLLASALGFFYRKEFILLFKKAPGRCIGWGLVSAFIALPMYSILAGAGGNRPWDISIFNPENSHSGGASPGTLFIANALSLLDPGFLFFTGDPNARHSVPGFGQTMLIALPFVAFYLYRLVRRSDRPGYLTLAAFVIGLAPAILTDNDANPHALRALAAGPFLEIISAAGITALLARLTHSLRPYAYAVVLLLYAVNTTLYLNAYFGSYRADSQEPFAYGHAQAIRAALDEREQVDHILVTPLIPHARLYALFFSRANPAEARTGFEPRKFLNLNELDPQRGLSAGRLLIVQKHGELGFPPGRWIRDAHGRPLFNLRIVRIHDPTN